MARNPKTGRRLRVTAREKGGKLTTKGRLSLARRDFALPPGPEERRRGIKGRYPIHDREHARNALARAAQMVKAGKLTPEEAARIRRAVKRRYPDIEVSQPRKRARARRRRR